MIDHATFSTVVGFKAFPHCALLKLNKFKAFPSHNRHRCAIESFMPWEIGGEVDLFCCEKRLPGTAGLATKSSLSQ